MRSAILNGDGVVYNRDEVFLASMQAVIEILCGGTPSSIVLPNIIAPAGLNDPTIARFCNNTIPATPFVTPSTAQSYNVFNVKNPPYNATGGGVVDDTAAIRAAYAALKTAGGGILYFPVGTYLMSGYLTLTSSNVIIMGAGWGSIIKQFGSTFANYGFFQGTGLSNIFVHDLMLQGNNVPDQAATATTVGNVTIPATGSNVTVGVSNTLVPPGSSLNIFGGGYWLIGNVVAGGGTSSLTVSVTQSIAAGDVILSGATVNVVQEDIVSQALGGSWVNCSNLVYERVYFKNMQQTALYIDGSTYTNCKIDKCVFDTVMAGRSCAPTFSPFIYAGNTGSTATQYPTNISITNCYALNAAYGGFWVATRYSVVDFCTFVSCGEARVIAGQDLTVSNCIDINGYMSQESGEFIESFSEGLNAHDNKCYNNGQTQDPWNTGNQNCTFIDVEGGRLRLHDNEAFNCKGGGFEVFTSAASPYTATTTTGAFTQPAIGAQVAIAATPPAGQPFVNRTTVIVTSGGHTVIGNLIAGAGTSAITILCTYSDDPGFSMPIGSTISATYSGHDISVHNNIAKNCGSAASTVGGIAFASGEPGMEFFDVSESGNVASGCQPFNYSLSQSYETASCSFALDSGLPGTLSSTFQTPNPATTNAQLLNEVVIGGGAPGIYGGFKATAFGRFNMTAMSGNTAQLILGLGGADVITIGGAWLVNDTATYTLNGHNVQYTAGASPTPASVAAGLAAAINADGTDSPLVSAVAGSYINSTGAAIGTVTLQALDPAFSAAATLAQSVTMSSVGGTIAIPTASLVTNIANYTSAANATSTYRIEANLNYQGSQYNPLLQVVIIDGTAIKSMTDVVNVSMNQFVNQSLRLYLVLGMTSEGNVLNNVMQYQRL